MEGDVLVDVVSTVLGRQIPSVEFTQTLKTLRLERLARLLHLRIAKLADPNERDDCRCILDQISEDAAERLLCSPMFCELLRVGLCDRFLKNVLSVEHAASTGKYIDAWSVLGDCWFGRESPAAQLCLKRDKGRYWSPRLTCGIPLDLSLPAFVKNPSAGLQRPFIPDAQITLHALNCMNIALDVLHEIYPFGYGIFTSLVSNIVVRGDAARAEECWGASSGAAISRIVIVNAQASADARMLGEVLLHEAIHCAIDCVELVNPLIQFPTSEGTSMEAAIPSPWTRNTLTPHAFLHACVVWAVLLRYWVACEVRYGADDVSETRRLFIERGFSTLDMQDDLSAVFQSLTEDASSVVAIARESVRFVA